MKIKNYAFKAFCVALALCACPFAKAQTEDYPISFDKEQAYTHATRRLNGVTLSGSADGEQTISVPNTEKVYNSADGSFTARAGETLTATFNYSGSWMHGYVYLDSGNDGVFDVVFNSDGSFEGDVLSFAYAEPNLGSGSGYNSAGASLSGPDVLNPPSFTIPEGLSDGTYLMRFKVDWASIDPAGRTEDGNGILRNGGAIFDVRINIHGDNSVVNAVAENGTIVAADGTPLTAYNHAYATPLTVKFAAADGYRLDALRIRYGSNLDDESQYDEAVIPAYLVQGNEYTIPAEYMRGSVALEAIFCKKTVDAVAEGDYPVAFSRDVLIPDAENRLNRIMFNFSSGNAKVVSVADKNTAYVNVAPVEVANVPGSKLTAKVAVAGSAKHYYLYVDLNNDGQFTPMLNEDGTPTYSGELLAYTYYNGRNSEGSEADASSAGVSLPAVTLPANLPVGRYRMRLKADNNNISPDGSATIVEEGGMIVDLLLNIYDTNTSLSLISYDGAIYGSSNSALPSVVSSRSSLTVVAVPVADGYETKELRVRHGYNLDGPQYIHGNRQWSEYTPSSLTFTIPKDSVFGRVEVIADFSVTDAAEWRLVFSDEFNTEDGTQPVNEKWMRCKRYSSTWNRWLSDSEEVIYIKDGNLVARAIPNPDTSTDNVPMITGGIKSMGRFGFTYGRVECRLLTNPWTGNFPALWMMPEDQSAGWPDCGEIDIFESIDGQNRTWHTVHSNWTYDLGKTGDPTSSFNKGVSLDRYHVYALEWDESSIVWFVDGAEVGRYEKSTVQSKLNQGQWPFDKHFHLILNQSVGNGSWAANADVAHTYETLFDWVRVYQKVGMKNTNGTVGVEFVKDESDVNITVRDSAIILSSPEPANVAVHDIVGRLIYNATVEGCVTVPVERGFYLVNGSKIHVK